MEDKLTGEQWRLIQPLIPKQTGSGKPKSDDRETLDAILWVTSEGCRWESLKRTDYSHHYTTAWRRLKRWEEDVTWKRILDSLISKGCSLGIVKMGELSIDSTTVPAKKGKQVGYDGHKHIKGSKVHAVTTRDSLPVAVEMGPGNQHEGRKLIPVMESNSIKGKRGRPRILYADTKYNMPLNKFYLDGKYVRSQMPDPPGKKKRPGRPRMFDKNAYNHVRSMIKRFNGRVKAFRRVATRFDRLPQVYMGFVHLACIMVYLRVLQ